ncbi:MAG: hypothetical protein Q8K48_07035 [Candidatus Planktophila sp.]|nr:hypothetical protein [Candidatus Planktophila sp.]
MDKEALSAYADYLRRVVGGYLYGTQQGSDFCEVCRTPVNGYSVCKACNSARVASIAQGLQLADHVYPIAYANNNSQSMLLMHGYKENFDPELEPSELYLNIILLIITAIGLHINCIQNPIQSITYVPSSKGRVSHPLRRVTEYLSQEFNLEFVEAKYVLPTESESRELNPDQYELHSISRALGHTLILEDTWTTGAHAQSLAAKLRSLGANEVSVLVVARWLRTDWPATSRFVAGAINDKVYEPNDCPFSFNHCKLVL